jgi:hypothetical protein
MIKCNPPEVAGFSGKLTLNAEIRKKFYTTQPN